MQTRQVKELHLACEVESGETGDGPQFLQEVGLGSSLVEEPWGSLHVPACPLHNFLLIPL